MSKIAQKTAQQGDVILRRLNKMPAGEQKVLAKRHLVLAEGEVTGHSHVIEEDESELIQIGEQIILKLEEQATLVHQEHGPITLDKGLWEVGRVQEYDYLSQMKRPVMD